MWLVRESSGNANFLSADVKSLIIFHFHSFRYTYYTLCDILRFALKMLLEGEALHLLTWAS